MYLLCLLSSLFIVAVNSETEKLQPSPCNGACTSCHNNICYACNTGSYLDATGLCISCTQCLSNSFLSKTCVPGGIVWSSSPDADNSLAGHYGSDSACKVCTKCGTGQFVKTACGTASDTVCQACSPLCQTNSPPGYETASCGSNHDLTCSPCTACIPGAYIKTACSETADTTCKLCRTCAANTYASTACAPAADTVCSACATCSVGFFVSAACTPTSNTQCQACTRCSEGQYEAVPCGDKTDTVCAPCSAPCSETHSYETLNCGANHDLTCAACTICPDGSYEKVSCTEVSDTECEGCLECPSGTWASRACTVTVDTVCSDCTECTEGWYISQACTSTTDTVCKKCTTCVAGTFAQTSCSDNSDAVCVSCSSCGDEEYISASCSAVQDTQCSACSPPCEEGNYEFIGCNGHSDRACQPYSPSCTEYLQYISTPGTPTSDVIYTTCTQSCPPGQYLSETCSTYTDSVCSACTVCGPDEFVVSECEQTADTVCQACSPCAESATILACGINHDAICTACPAGYFPSGYPFSYDAAETTLCPVHEEANWPLGSGGRADRSVNHIGSIESAGDVVDGDDSTQINPGGYLNMPATPQIDTRSFSWSWSMNLQNVGGRQILFADWSSYLWSFMVTYEGGNVVVQLRRDFQTSGSDPDQGLVTVSAPFPANTWVDFAFNFDHASRTASIYLGGVLSASEVVRPELTNLNLHAGSSFYQFGVKADDGFYGQMAGALKNLRIFTYSP